jgi:serine/threonine protein kinase/tetratricopeptide (TPR) repeat protein
MAGSRLGPYEVFSPIGAGGMGEVYRAKDTRLGRDVAIKVLPAEFAADPQRLKRFEQEARAVAALSHPNILAIHDIGSHEGAPFIVTELLEGETLRDRLKGGSLTVRSAVEIAVQIAHGVAAAHEKGIIHRDLKPGNVFITRDGHVKILDFGIAKLTVPRSAEVAGQTSTVVGATEAGTTLGTVGYMSPEQVRGQSVDHRADIFALGCIAYEMLAGHRPFTAATDADTVAAILSADPRPLAEAASEIPQGLEVIVLRCLEKRPEDRFTSARDVAFALLAFTRSRETPGRAVSPRETTRDDRPSVAVLPFVNLSADPEQEYFSDGLAEDILDALTQVPGLRVMARTSAFAFRGKEQDVREIGARLNVEHILEGSVRRAGSRLRVTAQLIKASDGYHLWSQRFDREMTDVFAIQDEISQAIVEKLRLRLAGDRPLVKRSTEDLAAYDLCLKARHHVLKLTQEGREAGRRYCEQAIALDPSYAPAHVVLAESHLWSAFWGSTDPREAFAGAKAAALEALRLDDSIADAHSALGTVLGSGEFDWPGAEREFSRAMELNRSSAAIRYDYAWCYAMWFLFPLGRVEQALTEMRRALELDPLDPFYNSLVGCLLYHARRFELAVAQLRHAIDVDPTFFFSYWFLSVAYRLSGRLDEAIAAAEKAIDLSGGNPITLGTLGGAYGRAGRTAEARQLLEKLTERRRSSYVPASALVAIHSGLGEWDATLEWIARGIEERDPVLVTSLRMSPHYDLLRSRPDFQALLRKMNLEP